MFGRFGEGWCGHGDEERGKCRGRGFGGGRPENCVCPSCGEKMPHKPGTPCREIKCPKCGTTMIRE